MEPEAALISRGEETAFLADRIAITALFAAAVLRASYVSAMRFSRAWAFKEDAQDGRGIERPAERGRVFFSSLAGRVRRPLRFKALALHFEFFLLALVMFFPFGGADVFGVHETDIGEGTLEGAFGLGEVAVETVEAVEVVAGPV